MKKIIILFLFCSSLFSLDWATIYKEDKAGKMDYEGSSLQILGNFKDFRCIKKERSIDSYCLVFLRVNYSGRLYTVVKVEVGTTHKSSLDNLNKEDEISYDCVYRGNLRYFKGCS